MGKAVPPFLVSHRFSTVNNDDADENDAGKDISVSVKPDRLAAVPAESSNEQRGSGTGGDGCDRQDEGDASTNGGCGIARTDCFALGLHADNRNHADAHLRVDDEVVTDELLELEIEIPVEEDKKAILSSTSSSSSSSSSSPSSASQKPMLLPPGPGSSPPLKASQPLRLFHSHQSYGNSGGCGGSSGGSAAGSGGCGGGGGEGDEEGCALTRTTSGSGASCFGVERGGGGGSSHEAFDEGAKRLSKTIARASSLPAHVMTG